MRDICATFRKPGPTLSCWANCSCADCTRMREALAAAGTPQVQFDRPLGPEKGQSRSEYIDQTVGKLLRHST